MADKRQLTDRFLRSLPPAKHGSRNDIWDTVVPTFGACVYDSKDSDPSRRGKAGRIAFVMYTRFKRGAAPARRIIGIYGATTLEDPCHRPDCSGRTRGRDFPRVRGRR